MFRWIDSEKRQPDAAGRYLVCLKREAPEDLGGNSRRIAILRWTGEGWRLPVHFPTWINDEIRETVTHWMPLPKLPRENKAEAFCPHGYTDWDDCPVCRH